MATITAVASGDWTTGSGALFSGGVMPTAADDVTIPSGISLKATSGAAVAVCRSLTVDSGATLQGVGQVYIGDASGGALTTASGSTITISGGITFVSTSTNGGAGWPITTNGKTLPNVTFNGVGGRWQLQDALTLATTAWLTLTNGTLDTNNQNVMGHTLSSSNNNVRAFTLGSSTLSFSSSVDVSSSGNLTFTANTATFAFAGGGGISAGGGFLNFNGASLSFSNMSLQATVYGNGRYANITVVGGANTTATMALNDNIVVTGTLTITGNSATNRVLCLGTTLGTPRVITAAAVSLTDVDFMDIAIVGPVGSTITSDSFNRADGALGTTDAAAGGSPLAWTVNGQITSNVVVGSSSTTNVVDVGVSDFSASITMTTLPSGGHAGLSVRGDGGAGTRIMFGASKAATPSRLQVILGYVTLVDLTMGLIPAGATMELRVIGSVAVALVNGVVYGSVAIPSTMTVTNKVGITTQPAAQMDNFIVKELPNVSGTRLGDCLGNSGITFTTASGTPRDGGGAGVKRYAVAAGNFSSTAVWSESDGGSAGASVPLPQDDVYLTASSGAGTYNINVPRSCRNLDCTGFTRTLNNNNNNWSLYGNLKIVPGMTWAFTSIGPNFRGRGSQTIDTSGVVPGGGITNTTVFAPGGSYTLLSDLSLAQSTQSSLTVVAGTFNANGYNVTANRVDASGTAVKAINFGSGTWTLGFNTTFVASLTSANTTVIANTSTIIVNAATTANRDFIANSVFGTVTYTVADSPGALILGGASTIGTLNIGAGRSLKLPVNTQTTVGTLNVAGVSRGGVRLPGVSGSYLSTPDSAAVSVTGDIDIRCRVALTDYTAASEGALVTKFGAAGQRSFRFFVDTAGRLNFNMSTDGTANTGLQWQAGPTFVDGTTYWVRTTRTAAGTLRFFYAADQPTMPTSWTEAGLSQTLSAGQNLFDSTSPVEIGSMTLGTAHLANGVFKRAQIRNNVLDDGTGVVFDTDFTPAEFDPFFLDTANGAIVTPSTTLANVGDGRVVIESSTAGTGATLNVTNPYQLEGVDIKDVTINGPVTLGAQSVVRTNVRGVKRTPRYVGMMVSP